MSKVRYGVVTGEQGAADTDLVLEVECGVVGTVSHGPAVKARLVHVDGLLHQPVEGERRRFAHADLLWDPGQEAMVQSAQQVRGQNTMVQSAQQVRGQDTMVQSAQQVRGQDTMVQSAQQVRGQDTMVQSAQQVRGQDTMVQSAQQVRGQETMIQSAQRVRGHWDTVRALGALVRRNLCQ